MARFGTISVFVLVLAIAASADAQCLSCYTGSGQSGVGYCAWSESYFCSRTCCYAQWGEPCQIPDFFDPCDWWSPRGSFKVSLFENRLPRPQILPSCQFQKTMKEQRKVEIPRRAAA